MRPGSRPPWLLLRPLRERGHQHRRSRLPAVGALTLSAVLHGLLMLAGDDWFAPTPTWSPVEAPTQRFVKRLPPTRRPLARDQRQRSLQRPLTRQPAARAAPVAALSPAPLTTQRQLLRGFPVPIVATAVPPPTPPLIPLSTLPTPHIGAHIQSGTLTGARTGSEEIDLGTELLDIQALDTGRQRAVVMVDPADPRDIKGFLYLSSVYSESMERASAARTWQPYVTAVQTVPQPSRRMEETAILQRLADLLSERTGVRAHVLDGLALSDPRLRSIPFLLFTASDPFELPATEVLNLGRYLASGGFLYAEVTTSPLHAEWMTEVDLPALRRLVRDALTTAGKLEGRDWEYVRLNAEHPFYRCYYEMDAPPLGYYEPLDGVPDYLEGIELHGRLAGIYSRKAYADAWAQSEGAADLAGRPYEFLAAAAGIGEREAALRLAVNILVYALTREGSLAQQLVAAE